jgi:uncharacterized protein
MTRDRTHLQQWALDITRSLGSILLGGLAIGIAVLLFRQGLLPLIEDQFQLSREWLSTIRRVGIPLVAVAAYWIYVRLHEKREATELHLQPVRTLLGAAGGVVLVALPITVLFVMGTYERVSFRGFQLALLGIAGLIVVAAILEELVYRCLVFRLLERGMGTAVALVLQAIVFAIPHLGNLDKGTTWDVVATLVSVTLLGLLWAGVFILTRNLWVAAANHAAWNFTILLSGVPLSGIEDWQVSAPIESRYSGPDWLTGGQFGPENSLVVMAFVVLALTWVRRRALQGDGVASPALKQD